MLQDNDELIVKFLGWEISKSGQKFKIDDMYPYGYVKVHPGCWYFRRSWNWIMPVVEEIQKRGFRFYMCSAKECRICRHGAMDEVIRTHRGETLIESVYRTVVEFIKWHTNDEE